MKKKVIFFIKNTETPIIKDFMLLKKIKFFFQ